MVLFPGTQDGAFDGGGYGVVSGSIYNKRQGFRLSTEMPDGERGELADVQRLARAEQGDALGFQARRAV